MRFLKLSFLRELRRCYFAVAPSLVVNKWSSLLTFSYRYSPPHYLLRTLSTCASLRKDVPLPKDQAEEKLDLDIWKSVMRSQVPPEDTKDAVEGAASEEEVERSPVEATRDLVDMWRQAGKLVPEHMTVEQLETLAELSTKSSKKKYLKYLAIKEGHKKANKAKKERKRAEKMAEEEEEAAAVSRDGVGEVEEGEDDGTKLKNSFMLQFWSRSLDRLLGWRGVQAMRFGQPLVFDLSYEQHMSRHEIENTASQLMESEGWNRRSPDPFHLHFCNLRPDSACQRELLRRYGTETWERLLVTATDRGHVDVFPRESLVQLTADSPSVLRHFDHSKVYVIGGMVDRSIQSGVSLANAKRLKLATARLPLDEYLHWDAGAKNLTLDQMIRILLTAKETGSWEKALEFVPKRKHDGFHQARKEGELRSGSTATASASPDQDRDRLFASKQRAPKVGVEIKPTVQRTFRAPKGDLENKPPAQVTFGKENPFPAQSRLRTALKSKMEEPSSSTLKRRKNFWEEG